MLLICRYVTLPLRYAERADADMPPCCYAATRRCHAICHERFFAYAFAAFAICTPIRQLTLQRTKYRSRHCRAAFFSRALLLMSLCWRRFYAERTPRATLPLRYAIRHAMRYYC